MTIATQKAKRAEYMRAQRADKKAAGLVSFRADVSIAQHEKLQDLYIAMTDAGEAGYRENVLRTARHQYSDVGQFIRFEAAAVIKEHAENGVFMQSWVWIDFIGTDLDKE